MANLYHKVTSPGKPKGRASNGCDPDRLHSLIDAFLKSCKAPSLLEPGDELIPLHPGEYELTVRAGRLGIEVWHGERCFSRRILSVEKSSTGTLDCLVHRFAGTPGKLMFLDIEKPQTAHRRLTGTRQGFAEQFRRMLYRQFPGWDIVQLSAAMDLQRSFSPVFPRAALAKGSSSLAALACPGLEQEHAFLTFALLWFDYQRAKGARELCLFLPEEGGCLTASRLRWLDKELRVHLFRFNSHGVAGQIDLADLGNLDSRVLPASEMAPSCDASSGTERQLEQIVRREVTSIEPQLRNTPLHNQVISFVATDRDIVDLLGITLHGRLAIIELKVDTDIHLPLQALDYWIHVKRHLERGELNHLFPGCPLETSSPLLRLVAPALAFHSTSASILRYFSPEIEVERVGINSDWCAKLRVLLRLPKGKTPQSHGGQYERAEFIRYQKSDQQS